MASVVLDQVSRIYRGRVVAVDRLDLHVRDGELLVLVGPSGCGKTTTLRLIAGLEPLTSGDVRIADRSVNRLAPRDRHVAMVFQGHALYPHLTVRQNLAFGLEMRRRGWFRRAGRPSRGHDGQAVERNEIAERVVVVARTLGVEKLLERMPAELSGGERQRVALGRALVRQPAVFLLDEPLSNLDALLRASLRSELKRLHQTLAATIVYVTHDQAEAMSLGDRIAVLDQGRLQQTGEPLKVYRDPANRFVAGFLGSPPMNLVDAALDCSRAASGPENIVLLGGGWAVEVERHWLPGELSGGRVVWGIRPEDIGLYQAATSPQPPAPRFQPRLSGCVTLVEPLGDAAVIHLAPISQNGGDTASPADQNRVLLVKTNDMTATQVGQRIEACFDAGRLHWFDALTGRSLRGFRGEQR